MGLSLDWARVRLPTWALDGTFDTQGPPRQNATTLVLRTGTPNSQKSPYELSTDLSVPAKVVHYNAHLQVIGIATHSKLQDILHGLGFRVVSRE